MHHQDDEDRGLDAQQMDRRLTSASRDSCIFGEDCRDRVMGRCKLLHPGDAGYTPPHLIPCTHGRACRYRRKGGCVFYHPQDGDLKDATPHQSYRQRSASPRAKRAKLAAPAEEAPLDWEDYAKGPDSDGAYHVATPPAFDSHGRGGHDGLGRGLLPPVDYGAAHRVDDRQREEADFSEIDSFLRQFRS
jgi:hypothetical protein